MVRNDGTETWYSLGHFIVNNPTDDNVKDNTSFKAVDYTKYFETPYVDKVTYPTTAGALAYSVCKQSKTSLGNFQASLTKDTTINSSKQYFTYDSTKDVYNLVVEPSASNLSKYYEINECFTNHDFVIEANQFVNNETCRAVIKAISMLAYSWVRIGWDDKCYLDFEVNTEIENDHIITNDDYYDLTTKNDYFGEVNKVIIGMKDVDGENTTLVDSDSNTTENFEITLWDNPLTYNQELREKAIVKANKLFGLKYKPVEMTTVGHPWLIGNELLGVVDMEDNTILTYPFDRTISYSGHIKTKIKSQAMSKTDTKYAYEGRLNNLGKSIKNTQIIVDKANQRIDAVVQTQEDLSDSLVPLATSNGVELKLEKSAGQPLIEFELEGNSEQASYEGTNLLNPNGSTATNKGVTLTNNGDGTFTVSGTSTEAFSIPITKGVIEMKADESYTNGVEILSGSMSNGTITVTVENEAGTKTYNYMNVSGQTQVRTRKITENLKIIGYSFYATANQTINCTFRPQFNKGSSKLPYEPYVGGTQSPNPDYPQEITVIEGDLSLKDVGENLIDFGILMDLAKNITEVENGYTFSPNTGAYSTGLELERPLPLPVSLSYKVQNGSGTNFRMRFWYDNGDKVTLSGGSGTSTEETTVILENITKPGANSIVRIGFDWTTAGSFTIKDFMINHGDKNKPYEPYQELITEIDLQGNFIAKLPNGTKDRLYLNQGHLYLEQNVGKIVLNGTENWNKDVNADNDTDYFYISGCGIDRNNIDSVMCDHFIKGSASKQGFWGTTVFVITINKTLTGIVASDTIDQRKTKFKTWLSENNVTVYYELATPIIHDLGEYSVETLKGNSTIRAISNLEPSNMYCKYIRNIDGLDVFQTKNDMADYYNVSETEERISLAKGEISSSVAKTYGLVDEKGNTVAELRQKVEQKITSDATEFNTIKSTLQNGVETLKNSLVTININGIQVSTNTSKINSVMQNDKFAIQNSSGDDLIFIGYDEELGASVSRMDNLTVTTYFTAGYHRTEGFTDEETNEPRTGWFYVGGSI